MKNFDLNACGVQELEKEEMQSVDGGFPLAMIIAAVAIVAVGAVELGNDIYMGRPFSVTDGHNLIV